MPDSALPKLLVSPQQAEEAIKAQISKGCKILADFAPMGLGFGHTTTLEASKAKGTGWARFTIDLLKTLLTDFSIDREFGSSIIYIRGG